MSKLPATTLDGNALTEALVSGKPLAEAIEVATAKKAAPKPTPKPTKKKD